MTHGLNGRDGLSVSPDIVPFKTVVVHEGANHLDVRDAVDSDLTVIFSSTRKEKLSH